MPSSLAEALKRETRSLHTQVERSDFLGRLLRGRMDLSSYCGLLRNLHAVYHQMEISLDRSAELPLISPLWMPELRREPALQQDLAFLWGDDWRRIALQATTIDYVARLVRIEAEQPALLVAHSYVRYLGDLNGGQMLGRIVRDSVLPQRASLHAGATAARPNLDVPPGTAFYDFGNAATTADLKQRYRNALNGLMPDPDTATAIVAEAVVAFELHGRLFDELSATITA